MLKRFKLSIDIENQSKKFREFLGNYMYLRMLNEWNKRLLDKANKLNSKDPIVIKISREHSQNTKLVEELYTMLTGLCNITEKMELCGKAEELKKLKSDFISNKDKIKVKINLISNNEKSVKKEL